MRRLTTISTTLFLSLFLISSFGYGQSLADIARQNQQEKQKNADAEKKVVTNDDLNPISAPKPAEAPAPEPKKVQPKGYDKLGTTSFTPETWTKTIKAQKDWVTFLQKEADKLKTPPKFDQKQAATDREARKYWEERNIQQQYASQIPEQQQKLKDMQLEAQKAGMPDSVVDPQ